MSIESIKERVSKLREAAAILPVDERFPALLTALNNAAYDLGHLLAVAEAAKELVSYLDGDDVELSIPGWGAVNKVGRALAALEAAP